MNPNDAFHLTKPLSYDEAKRRLNQAFVLKLTSAVDYGFGDIDAMRQAYLHGDLLELGRLVSASMDIYNAEFGENKI
jgi:hypothetical protein